LKCFVMSLPAILPSACGRDPFATPPPPPPEVKQRPAPPIGNFNYLALPDAVRSEVLRCIVGELLTYAGFREVSPEVEKLRILCSEIRTQIDNEVLTLSCDDVFLGPGCTDMQVRRWEWVLEKVFQKHRWLRYAKLCISKRPCLDGLLERSLLPSGVQCEFALECELKLGEVRQLLSKFDVQKLNFAAPADGTGEVDEVPDVQPAGLFPSMRHLCVRGPVTAPGVQGLIRQCPSLSCLQIVDNKQFGASVVAGENFSSLSLIGLSSLPDDSFSQIVAQCPNLVSLCISKCRLARVRICSPKLESLAITHCRQFVDECVSEIVASTGCPNLRFLDLSGSKGLVHPLIASSSLETIRVVHCPQVTDNAITQMFEGCTRLLSVNLLQSTIEIPTFASHTLEVLELATCQKLTDSAVTQLLRSCDALKYLDLGHCCQLQEPVFKHHRLEQILLTFCVNLKEASALMLLEECPQLRYVELAVCMFDMQAFKKKAPDNCEVIVNFGF